MTHSTRRATQQTALLIAFGAVGGACAPDTERGADPFAPAPTAFAITCDAAACSGGLMIDQQQSTISDDAPFTFAIGGASGQIIAQVFTPSFGDKVGAVAISAACAPASDLVVEIRELSGGLPTGALLAEEFVPGSSLVPLGPPGVFNAIAIRPSARLTVGTPYALVLRAPTGSCGAWPGPVGDPYAGGDGFAFGSAEPGAVWVPLSLGTNRADLPFRTYMK